MHSTRGAPSTSITEAARAPLLARRERLQLLGEVGHRLCPVQVYTDAGRGPGPVAHKYCSRSRFVSG